jgi:hypothetical protein
MDSTTWDVRFTGRNIAGRSSLFDKFPLRGFREVDKQERSGDKLVPTVGKAFDVCRAYLAVTLKIRPGTRELRIVMARLFRIPGS